MSLKNPWKKLSKVNPQREEGRREISNDVLKALMMADLTGSEFKIVLCVIDKTWGFHKQSDTISNSQFMAATGLAERTVRLATKSLKDRRIIYYDSPEGVQGYAPLNEYLFNKHYDTWSDGGAKFCRGAKKCHKGVHGCAPTKETLTKEKKPLPLTPKKGDRPLVDNGRLRKPSSGRKADVEEWLKALGPVLRPWFEEVFWPDMLRKESKKATLMGIYDLNPNAELRTKIVEAYRRQRELDFKFREPRYVPHPSTWINESRWNDEVNIRSPDNGKPKGDIETALCFLDYDTEESCRKYCSDNGLSFEEVKKRGMARI